MLEIRDLIVSVHGRKILDGVNLELATGKSALLLGQNGCGKSTLIQTLIGMKDYQVESGDILVNGESILGLSIEERVERGLGIMVQLPPVIEGVSLVQLVEEIKKIKEYEVTRDDFDSVTLDRLKERNVNENFSGGELKQSELFQLLHLRPKIALIDEPESGVDIENIHLIGRAVRRFLKADKDRTSLIITHSGKIINYTGDLPAFLMDQGRIVRYEVSGKKLIHDIEQNGFLKLEGE